MIFLSVGGGWVAKHVTFCWQREGREANYPSVGRGQVVAETIPTVPASSAYMDHFVVEPQLGILIGLWPSFRVNLNLNHCNIQYRVLPVLILLLLWLWPIGVQPFSGGGVPINKQIGPGGITYTPLLCVVN